MSLPKSNRARQIGGNRGGIGGGYERTDPDYDEKKLKRLKEEFNAMDIRWRSTFLEGLSRYEQEYVQGRIDRD